MAKVASRVRLLAATLAVILFCGLTIACKPLSPSSSRGASPTATLYVFPPTPTPEQVTVQTGIAATPELYPSSDGTLIAAEYILSKVNAPASYTIRLYTVSGQELGTPYTSADDIAGEWSWLVDSSGILLESATNPGLSRLILDRQGRVHPLSLPMTNMTNLELSPDGRWFGGTAIGSNDAVTGAEIVPRRGGPARMQVPGSTFMGWQNGRAVYVTGGSSTRDLYALDPSGGAPLLIAQYPPDNACFPGPPYQNISGVGSSPDGQVLLIASQCTGTKMLVGNTLLPLPFHPGADPMEWVGPHDVIGIANQLDGSGDYVILDIVTGKVIRDTGLSASFTGGIVALSGDWMVTSNDNVGVPSQLNLVNYMTKASYIIDPDLTSITALGNSGKFACLKTTVVATKPTPGLPPAPVYIIDPALIG